VVVKVWPRAQTANPGVDGVDARRWVLWLVLVCASLWWWNLDTDLDDWGVYFWGSYGLGLLAWEARRFTGSGASEDPVRSWMVGALMVLVGGVAWWLEPRARIALAWGVAALLITAPSVWLGGQALGASRWRSALEWLSGVSYSVFLIHFGVSLAVSAVVTAYWPDALWANVLGVLLALLLSLLLGGLLCRWVERQPPTVWRWWFWVGAFKASVALALFMNPVA
jgi:peptidoglycan/LPS O-acetylase OafA/YrhL